MSVYLMSVVTLATIYAIAAVGCSLIVTFGGHITNAMAAMMGVGAYAYAILTQHGIEPVVALAVSPGIAAVAGGVAILFMSGVEQHLFLLATLALQFVGVEVFARWGSLTGGNAGLAGIVRPLNMNDEQLLYLCVGVLLILLALLHRPLKGVWGLRLRAIRDDPIAAAAFGTAVTRELTLAFVLSAATGGLAGALLAAQASFIVPESFGINLSLLIVVMAIVGGANIWFVTVAAAALVALPEILYSTFEVPSSVVGPMQQIAYGGALVLVMLFRPTGLGPESRARIPGSKAPTPQSEGSRA